MNTKHNLLICLLLLFIPLPTYALTQLTLEWQANTEPNIADYKAFTRRAGEAYDFAEPLWVGTETWCVIEIPDDEQPFYFVVRAFSTEGSGSLNSNEVCFGCTSPESDTEELLDSFDNTTSADSGCFIRCLHQ